MIKILIVDDNLEYAIKVMNYINKTNQNIQVYNIVENEKKALNILNNRNDIDIVILSLDINAEIEFMELLEDKEKYKKSIIVISENLCNYNKLCINNVIYSIIQKTVNIKEIIKKINELIEVKNKIRQECTVKEKIINEILNLNYDMSNLGTQYLVTAIEYIIINMPNKDFNNLKTEVYPFVAEFNNTSVHNVKNNIVRATDKMYCQCEIEKLKKYFHYYNDTKPDTRTIIRTVINKVS